MAVQTKNPCRIGMISLGCNKNLVDSEVMLGLLNSKGYAITPRTEDAEIIIVNTCSFIEDAKREAIDTILEMAQFKKEGRCRFLIVAGCLAQECGATLFSEMPEIDALVGPGEIPHIVTAIEGLTSSPQPAHLHFLKADPFLYDHTYPRMRTTWPHLAYIKIADGCNHRCSYCLIPKLRGAYRERTSDSILAEAMSLIEGGVKEICLVAQDITAFQNLHILLERLAMLPHAPWIRLLYTYPPSIDRRLIETMATYPHILPYLDMPLQHSHPRVLKAMNRPGDMKKIEDLVYYARSVIPDIVIRTTFMVGFPGETDEEFEHLLSFVHRIRFDRLGVFAYSREESTPACHMPDQVPKGIKQRRYRQLLKAQALIAQERNRSLLGKTMEAIVDYEHPSQEGIMVGRTKGQAPQIDGITFIKGREFTPGKICTIEITKTDIYDLEGVIRA